MEFNAGKTRIRITFLFAVGMTLFVLQTDGITVFFVLSAVVLHELTHFVFVSLFAGPPQKITVGLFGMCMSDERMRLMDYKKEAVCALSAPCVNLLCFLLFFGFQRLQTAATVHLSLGICNSLPLRCLDGGRGLFCLLCLRFPAQKAVRIMNVTEWIFFFVIWILLLFYMFLSEPTPTAFIFLSYLTFLFLFRK